MPVGVAEDPQALLVEGSMPRTIGRELGAAAPVRGWVEAAARSMRATDRPKNATPTRKT